MESSYADAYKLKSGTIDKRQMRVERRSIDWKSQRHDLLQKRRNMSPLAESFQNSSTMSISNEKSTMNAPSGKKSEDVENSQKGKISAKAQSKAKESADLKTKLSKWKQEKEAKKKLEALEKARKQTFKVGKLEHKDNKLFNVGPTFNKRKSKPVEQPQKSLTERKPITKVTEQKPVRNLKRKGDDLHSSTTKRQVIETKNVGNASFSRSLRQKLPVKEIKKTKTPPPKRITRRTKVVESRLFAATASTAAKQAAPTKTVKPAVERKVTRSAAAEKKKNPPKALKTATTTVAIPCMPSPEKDSPREIQLEKVNVSRGNAYFPEEFSFTAPANLKSYTFNPLSPDSATNFLFTAKDTTISFSIDSPEGRCSTPTPRQKKEKKNENKKSEENIVVTVKQDVQEHQNTETENDANDTIVTTDSDTNKSADDSANKTTLENTILERTVTIGVDENDIKVSVTPKKVTSDEEKPVAKTRSGVRKSTRLSSLNDSVSTDSQTEVRTNSPAPRRHKSLRNRTEEMSTSESSESEMDSKKKTPRTRRSLRKSVHTNNLEEDHSLPIITEASPPKSFEEAEEESILSETMLSKSISKYDDSVFIHEEPKPEKKAEMVLPESSSEDNEKVSTSVSMIESSITTPKAVSPETSKRLSKSAERTGAIQDDGFRTPGVPMSAQRRTRRKTVGSSTPSKARSPEEWVKILAKSPMIEMNRRTPKKSPVAENRIEQPNFDDIEEILNNSLQVEPDSTTTSETEIVHTADDTHSADVHNADVLSVDVHNADEPPTTVSTKTNGGPTEPDVAPQVSAGSTRIQEKDSEDDGSKADTGSKETKTTGTDEEPMEVDAQGSDDNAAVEDSGKHDVKYFRNLTKSETVKLSTFNTEWNKYLQQNNNLTEEVAGSIRTVVGQAQLLMDQRFKQFNGLIDDCEFKTGEKETKCEDLQGFWDMIYFQVEDVQKKFEDLGQRKDKNWVVEQTKAKKVLKKKATKIIKPAAKSKFAAFRAEMQKQKEAEATNKKLSPQMAAVKIFDAGFFKVNSPVKKSPHFHCEGGTPRKSKPQNEDKKCNEHDDTEQMDTEETKTVEKEATKLTEDKESENNEANDDTTAENVDDTTESKSKNSKRLPLSVLTPSGHNVRTPRRKSYAPNVPSPLLQDITPKLKTRRSLAANLAAQAIDAIDVCPLTTSDAFMTTPKSTGRSKRGTPKVTEDTTPRRRSLRVRKSVCFTETPSNQTVTEPIIETDDLSLFLQPTVQISSPGNNDTLLLDEDSPFTLKHFEEAHSAKKSTRASSRRKSTKKSPSDEKRRRSTRRSVHFDKSPACTHVKSVEDDVLFTPPKQQTFSTPTSKSRPSLLFTPPGKENTSIDTDNLMSFTP